MSSHAPFLLTSTLGQDEIDRLMTGRHAEPHAIFGVHPASHGRRTGVSVRAFHPEAKSVECVLADGEVVPMPRVDARGLFEVFLPDRASPVPYRLRFHFEGGGIWERDDPYRFLPTLGEFDLHLVSEGKHRRLWEALGAIPCRVDGVDGVRFSVWAPNAQAASVVGDFCGWDGRLLPMRSLGASGVWELFVPGVEVGADVQVRDSHAGRRDPAEGRPDGAECRAPADERVAGDHLRLRLGRRHLDEAPRRSRRHP